jgi:hypothetical protein
VPYLFFLIWTTSYFAFLHYSIGGAQPISVGCCLGLKLCPSIWLLSAPIWRWFVLPPLRGVLHVGHGGHAYGYPYLYLVMALPSQFLFTVVTISAYQPDNPNLPEMLGLGQWDLKYLFGYHLELPCSLWRSLGLIRPMRLLSGTGLEDGTAVWNNSLLMKTFSTQPREQSVAHGNSMCLLLECLHPKDYGFFSQFCDVATVTTMHKRKEPNLATGQRGL